MPADGRSNNCRTVVVTKRWSPLPPPADRAPACALERCTPLDQRFYDVMVLKAPSCLVIQPSITLTQRFRSSRSRLNGLAIMLHPFDLRFRALRRVRGPTPPTLTLPFRGDQRGVKAAASADLEGVLICASLNRPAASVGTRYPCPIAKRESSRPASRTRASEPTSYGSRN